LPPPAPEWLVVGLGNPGARYVGTRHNLGFLVVEQLARRWRAGPWEPRCQSLVAQARLGKESILLAKPQTFMNRSGQALRELIQWTELPPDRLLVVHDDLDLPLGLLRIRVGGGAGGHNGIRSAVECLGTEGFLRLKGGIGRPEDSREIVDFVLSPFTSGEQEVLPALLGRAVDAVESIIVEGPSKAMNRFHT